MTLRIDDNAMGGAATWLRARKRTVAGDRDHDLAGYEKIDGQLAPTVLPTEAEAFYAEALCDLTDGQHAISVNRTSIGSDMAENN
jgi:hypothetical protein